ncbi:hypothetical protein KOR42_02660 [Thalassoglobus neptunius]|uniref:DUF455 domain-containing protein n=1 Tax=Thalassoglobus neptunius TaxID=1938619 RepID=A0A5C5X254_9PLAN|nr:ferritin-like domain-containing protein [Thalassoglobus neptunius]TWT56910.1 hypothetical protein KOR42_02660 [Thalassoglobus neptunius]
MEIRRFAEEVLLSSDLQNKLQPVTEPMTDLAPGHSLRVPEPTRPENLQFAPRRAAPKMPAPGALSDPKKRAVTHHILANHELQALEVMAWTLLAFPEAPADFRMGIVEIMKDEQRHTRMHSERAAKLGINFGELPVNCYIWKKAMQFESIVDYLAGLPLVFEGRNLDHTLELEQAFLAVDDQRSATIMRKIHDDEIEHVAFGLNWLRKLKPDHLSDWEAFEQHLHWPLRPSKAKGEEFQRQARLDSGMTEEFIDRLEQSTD